MDVRILLNDCAPVNTTLDVMEAPMRAERGGMKCSQYRSSSLFTLRFAVQLCRICRTLRQGSISRLDVRLLGAMLYNDDAHEYNIWTSCKRRQMHHQHCIEYRPAHLPLPTASRYGPLYRCTASLPGSRTCSKSYGKGLAKSPLLAGHAIAGITRPDRRDGTLHTCAPMPALGCSCRTYGNGEPQGQMA
jgi:hypothetical protein